MTRLRNRVEQKSFRKELRNEGTASEAVLWSLLKGQKLMGRKFRRQDGFGPYVVDFHCPDEKLVIEIDGGAHEAPGQEEHDEMRKAYLTAHGLRILRFDNKEILDDDGAVIATIAAHFTQGGQQSVDSRAEKRSATTRQPRGRKRNAPPELLLTPPIPRRPGTGGETKSDDHSTGT